MESLKITGVKRIAINDDSERVIEFNPTDVLFVERFYAMYREFEAKQKEFDQRSKELDMAGTDKAGMPAKIEEGIAFLKEMCEFIYERIDHLFGEGASRKVFEGAYSLEMIAQFFEGITPFIWEVRNEKVKKYTNTAVPK